MRRNPLCRNDFLILSQTFVGRRGRPFTADYLLTYRNTKLGVVKAKAWDEELAEGGTTAKSQSNDKRQ